MRARVTNRLITIFAAGTAAMAAASSLTACGTDGATPKCDDTQQVVDASDPDATVLMGDCLYGPGYATSDAGSSTPSAE